MKTGVDFMRKLMGMLLAVLLLVVPVSDSVLAEDNSRSFLFDLTVDGKDTRQVETGDIITIVLRLKRTDSSEAYPMYAMQDEIRYDSTFFKLVEGSALLNTGIASTDIGMIDHHRKFYMNYLSMSGGTQWESNMLIGSFQLEVIGTTGAAKIRNTDFLVSVQDGSDRYVSTGNDVTIILSADCIVSFETNGGTAIADQTVQFGEKLTRPKDPEKEGYELEGWYKDIHLTEEWNFEEDTVEENIKLYAKWVEYTPKETACQPWWIILLMIILIILVISYIVWKRKRQR